MVIGILSAELDEESLEENELLEAEIERAGHEPIILNYHKGFVDLNTRKFYNLNSHGQSHPVSVDVVIPRINEAEIQSISLGTLALQVIMSDGTPSITSPAAIELAKNKAKTLLTLESAGILTPRSLVPTGVKIPNPTNLLEIIETNPNQKIVLKNIYGTLGEGTKRLDSRVSAKSVLEDNHEPALIQEFVKLPGFPSKATDIRIIVVDSQAVVTYKRQVPADVDFRTNVYRWGEPVDYKPSKEEINLAIRAAKALDLEIAGVDIFPTRRGLLVNELNASSGFGIGKQVQFTVARAIVDYAIKKAQKMSRRR